jgi:hypothetical protein
MIKSLEKNCGSEQAKGAHIREAHIRESINIF